MKREAPTPAPEATRGSQERFARTKRVAAALGVAAIASLLLPASNDVTMPTTYYNGAELPLHHGTQIKVISANVHGFRGSTIIGLRKLIESEKPDAVCLQEATKEGLERLLTGDEVAVMAPTKLNPNDELVGNAFISMHPIGRGHVTSLPAEGNYRFRVGTFPYVGGVSLPLPSWLSEPRNTLEVPMATEDMGDVRFIVSHLSYVPAERDLQTNAVASQQRLGGAILCADVNMNLDHLMKGPLATTIGNLPDNLPPTFPAVEPTETIDIIGGPGFTVVNARAEDFGSDHKAMVAILDPAPDAFALAPQP